MPPKIRPEYEELGFPASHPEHFFWANVDTNPDGCWEWEAFRDSNGYGRCHRLGEQLAHRIAYKLMRGPIPEGLDILHKCDNPGCVRPSHLEAGTHQQNMKDRDARGRTSRGQRHADIMRAKGVWCRPKPGTSTKAASTSTSRKRATGTGSASLA